ncbi:MAG: hypothetical protein WBP41_07565 [Saprospiraceae bacterium]
MTLVALLVTSLLTACNAKNIKVEIESHTDILNSDSISRDISILDTVDCKPKYDSIFKRKVYLYVPEMPVFPGGTEEMYKYLYKTLTYKTTPDSFQTLVIITFIVETDGRILDAYSPRPKYKNGLSSLEKQVIHILRNMPKWKPGKCNNKNVPTMFTLPIRLEWQ